MANKVLSKVNTGIKFLYRQRDFLDTKLRKVVSMSMLQPHFDYGCTFWYLGLNCYLCKRLQCAQNKIIRFILNKDSRFHLSYENHKMLNILKVSDRVDYLILNTMHSIFYDYAPSYLRESFPKKESYIRTRYSINSFVLPRVNTQGSKTLRFRGVKLWNNLESSIKNCADKFVFKRKLRDHLFNKMMMTEQDSIVWT